MRRVRCYVGVEWMLLPQWPTRVITAGENLAGLWRSGGLSDWYRARMLTKAPRVSGEMTLSTMKMRMR